MSSISPNKIIQIMVVDDSPTVLEYTKSILNDHPCLQVIGTANNGHQALEATHILKPDVIVMDINMPMMNGFEATRKIMEQFPTPIVIMSGSWDTTEVLTSFLALEAGALAVLARPGNLYQLECDAAYQKLIDTVITVSEIKVIKRMKKDTVQNYTNVKLSNKLFDTNKLIKVVAIGTSTGGPLVLKRILSELPKQFQFPIIIAQHISKGFINGFSEWLQQTINLDVHVIQENVPILPGIIYICPDDKEICGINKSNNTFHLSNSINGHSINIDNVFLHINKMYGSDMAGIILTGMGKDGAQGLLHIKNNGGITIAQDEASSLIYGMPKEAFQIGAVTYVYSIEQIIQYLISNCKSTNIMNDVNSNTF